VQNTLSDVLQRDLTEVREAVLWMAGQVEIQLDGALEALRRLDRDGAQLVLEQDHRLNDACRQVRERCADLIAGQRPVAEDLRAVLATLHLATELERMGDYAVRLARRACLLAELPRRPTPIELSLMGSLAGQQVRDILDAIIDRDAERAVEIAGRDGELDQLYRRIFDQLLRELASDNSPEGVRRVVTLTQAAHDLERIGDRVTNLAEDVVFLRTGRVVDLGRR
jgi:phosphate transport system protein